jgi:hypothetical protein
MHALAVERRPENFRVFVSREHEDSINVVLPHGRMAMTRQRKPALFTGLAQVMEILADALFFAQGDPMRQFMDAPRRIRGYVSPFPTSRSRPAQRPPMG